LAVAQNGDIASGEATRQATHRWWHAMVEPCGEGRSPLLRLREVL